MNQIVEFGSGKTEEVVPTTAIIEFDHKTGPRIVVKPRTQDAITEAYSAEFGQPVEEVRPKVEINSSELDIQANARTNANQQQLVREVVGAEAREELDLLQREIDNTRELKRFLPPSVLSLLTSSDPTQRQYAATRLGKFFTLKKLFEDRLVEAEDHWIGDWMDLVASSPLHAFGIKKKHEMTAKLENLLLSDLSVDKFEEQVLPILDEMADAGFFTENNYLYLGDFIEFFTAGPHSASGKAQDLLYGLDTVLGVAELGASAALRSGASRVALTSGARTKAAMDAGIEATGDILSLINLKKSDPKLAQDIIARTVIIDDPTTSAVTLGNHTSPSSATPALQNGGVSWSEPSATGMLHFELNSEALREGMDILGFSGEAIDKAALEALAADIKAARVEALTESEATRYIDTLVDADVTENIFVVDLFGTKKGEPFKVKGKAQELADNINGLVVSDGKGGWRVAVQRNEPAFTKDINNNPLVLQNDLDDMASGFWHGVFGSTLARTTTSNNAVLKQGEAAYDRWLKYTRTELDKVDKLVSKSELNEVMALFKQLQDGVLNVEKGVGYTDSTFKTHFNNTYGRVPSEAQVAVFRKYQEFLDADLFFRTDTMFKRMVADGVEVMVDGDATFTVSRKSFDTLDETTKVYDVDKSRFVDKGSMRGDEVIYANYDPINQKMYGVTARYYTKRNPTVRRLYHTDIMARNTGGPRMYEIGTGGFYVKQNVTTILDDGTKVKGVPRTILLDKTESIARKGAEELNVIIRAIKERVSGKITYEAVEALASDPSFVSIVRTSTKFDTDIQDVASLVTTFKERGLSFADEFDVLADGEKLIDDDVLGGFGGMRMSDAIRMRPANARGVKPLKGYGGTVNKTLAVNRAVRKSLAQTAGNQTERAYLAKSIQSLIKTGIQENAILNVNDIQGKTLRQMLDNVQFGKSDAGPKLAMEKATILRRINQRGLGDVQWETAMRSIATFLYNKDMMRAGDFVFNMGDHNPLSAIRAFAFHRALGMFALDQIWVQASQVNNVMAVAGVAGLKGTAAAKLTLFLTINQSDEVASTLAKRMAPIMGITEDQFIEMAVMFRKSGRNVVDASMTELTASDVSAFSFNGVVDKIARAGKKPFELGELIARASGHNTAYLEYLTKFPGKDPMSQHGKRWIAHRQDVLTQGMTSASRTQLEKLPFMQFMSYTFRINEALFAGTFGGKAVLTKAERVRLGTAHLVLYGMSGFLPTSMAAKYIQDQYGMETDVKALQLARYGAIDAALTMITGEQTAIAERIGGGDGLYMIMKDMAEQNIFTTLAGPSGATVVETSGALWSVAKSLGYMVNGVQPGEFKDLQDGLVKAGRLFSSGNKAHNVVMAFRYQQYLSKSGALIASDVSSMQGVLMAFGVPLEEYNRIWDTVNITKIEKAMLKPTIKKMQALHNEANVYLDRGDYDAYLEIMRQMALRYHTMPIHDRVIVEREVFDNYGSMQDSIILRDMQRQNLKALEEYR